MKASKAVAGWIADRLGVNHLALLVAIGVSSWVVAAFYDLVDGLSLRVCFAGFDACGWDVLWIGWVLAVKSSVDVAGWVANGFGLDLLAFSLDLFAFIEVADKTSVDGAGGIAGDVGVDLRCGRGCGEDTEVAHDEHGLG